MSKLIDKNKLLTIKNYSKKHDVCYRKVYRCVKSNNVEFETIDGIIFIYDKIYDVLNLDFRTVKKKHIVKPLTNEEGIVKPLTNEMTKNIPEDTLKDDNHIVKPLTNAIVKPLTKENLTESEKIIYNSPDIDLSIVELDIKDSIIKRLNN
jgi:hypothetical protein